MPWSLPMRERGLKLSLGFFCTTPRGRSPCGERGRWVVFVGVVGVLWAARSSHRPYSDTAALSTVVDAGLYVLDRGRAYAEIHAGL